MNYSSYDTDANNNQISNTNDIQNSPQSSQNSSNKQQNIPQPQQNNVRLFTKIMNIFNEKTGTILSTAIGMTIGFSFKDLISSIVTDFLQPIVVIIMSYAPYLRNSPIFTKYESSINITSLFSSIFTFILIIISIYYIDQFIKKIQ